MRLAAREPLLVKLFLTCLPCLQASLSHSGNDTPFKDAFVSMIPDSLNGVIHVSFQNTSCKL